MGRKKQKKVGSTLRSRTSDRSDDGGARRRNIIHEHGDGLVLWKQLELPEGRWIVCVVERGDPIAGHFWAKGAPVGGDRSLRFFGADRLGIRDLCEVCGATDTARVLTSTPPDGHALVVVFAAGGTAVAIHPELDVTIIEEGAGA